MHLDAEYSAIYLFFKDKAIRSILTWGNEGTWVGFEAACLRFGEAAADSDRTGDLITTLGDRILSLRPSLGF
jgi:hypothetical protein